MSRDLLEDPSGTREEILAATLDSLREHGYADLTIDKIGDEFEKSQSLIYHHYDGKDDLVLDTLDHILEQHRAESFSETIDDPREQLEEMIDQFFERNLDTKKRRSLATLFELRAQAIHDEAYRKHFSQSDDVYEEFLVDIFQEGVDEGVFRACDPVQVASMVTTVINGVLVRRSTSDSDDWLNDVQEEFERYLEKCVYADQD